MTAQEVAKALNARRAGKGKWSAKCPCHKDRLASLSIWEGKTAVMLNCFAGCDKKSILASVGIGFKDLFYHSRDLPSSQLKAIYCQQRIDRMYAAEVRRQDLLMFLNAIGKPRKPRVPTQFELDIEAFCARFPQ